MSRKNAMGLSLVELMIAMAIGLVVVGSVLSFTMSSLNTNTEYVQATRLSQELRNSMDFISRELRRSGYDQNVGSAPARYAVNDLPDPTFARIFTSNDANGDGVTNDSCVIYAYDRNDDATSAGAGTGGVVDLDNGEIRALRLGFTPDGVGVLEVAESFGTTELDCGAAGPNYTNYPPSRNSITGWSALSDPRVLNLTQFTLDTSGYVVKLKSATSAPVVIREIGVFLEGQLLRSEDGTVKRGIQSNVKVRADCIGTTTECIKAPTEI